MIEEITGRPEGTLEFRITGHVTSDDYDRVITPAIDRALEDGGRVRVLIQVGPGFEGYSPEAAWDDLKLGLRHWRGFDRIAMVTDTGWLRGAIRGMSFLMPCPVMVFGLDGLDDARRWLQESLGTVHVTEIGERQLQVALHGKLDTQSIADAETELNAFIARAGGLELLLDLRDFDGWQGLGALGEHFGLIRDHYRIPSRIAVVGDQSWQRLAEQVMSRFVDAEVKHYKAADFEAAKAWIVGGEQ
ncbi:STAS/SEC14 domain-containing protein [Tropicimonas isoalkanivorans]|uniref:SpoIIAA-like n=1 Tax=Tropicimonas isoalkanivorans TaxID=441112 RepID=A0A1I1G2S9_9RHOB|nr:STAS/SEC14 domain-containing protein [Tropicimonas isoalkanivorans]SFC05602.1 SpoIIAA-like [Tropicimonas isoalkanivorans]